MNVCVCMCVRACGQIISGRLLRDSATLSPFCTNIASPLVATTDPSKTLPYISCSAFCEPNNSRPVPDKHPGLGKTAALLTYCRLVRRENKEIKKIVRSAKFETSSWKSHKSLYVRLR